MPSLTRCAPTIAGPSPAIAAVRHLYLVKQRLAFTLGGWSSSLEGKTCRPNHRVQFSSPLEFAVETLSRPKSYVSDEVAGDELVVQDTRSSECS